MDTKGRLINSVFYFFAYIRLYSTQLGQNCFQVIFSCVSFALIKSYHLLLLLQCLNERMLNRKCVTTLINYNLTWYFYLPMASILAFRTAWWFLHTLYCISISPSHVVTSSHNSLQVNDIRMVKLSHDAGLAQKVLFLLLRVAHF